MRQLHTISELTGLNRCLTVGTTVVDEWDWSGVGVQVGDAVENRATGAVGSVSSVGSYLETDVQFSPGDPYIVTLSADYTVSSSEGPVYELVCGLCGFRAKKDELETYGGRCKTCHDPDPKKEMV